ncbi:hypothetical protein [Robiginitalea sp. SC105]|uniref:hypothetical protein n=1 Tax=Robiginitalea sp. SC105 TaxID=2762332 RepID=UPI001639B746|nr:hypothetical protein [Robiginitalea sp. SC105]MBC2838875.1 hypothetical protein [Robiginitalea sp. SC105]
MKPISKNLRICALLLNSLILFQSCVVYHKTPVSLHQAAQGRARGKVVTAGKTVDDYAFFTESNGRFYGVKMELGNELRIPIEDSPDTQIYLKNKNASTIRTVLLFTGVGIIVIAAMYISFSGDIYSGGFGFISI